MSDEILGRAVGALTNHLWQSTMFAVAVGLLTLVFRKNRAQVRYWLWLSASFKFLLPFALLMSLGSGLWGALAARKMTTEIAAPAVSLAMVEIAQPFPDTLLSAAPAAQTAHWFPAAVPLAIFGVWLCGFLVIVVLRAKDWLRIRAAVRAASPIEEGEILRPSTAFGTQKARSAQNDNRNLKIAWAPGLLEPGVVGFVRPTLLLPDGVAERLTAAQLAAVLAHELCHVRRRDNLTAALHMIVEAIFWFHPLVWWIGARLVEEREQACDEEVLRLGNDAKVYAESILNVCKSYVESPLRCVSGISGADLKKRVRRIMRSQLGETLNGWRKLFLVGYAVAALAAPLALGVLRLEAQAPAVPDWQKAAGGKMAFEVASVKQDNADPSPSNVHTNIPLGPLDFFTPTGGLLSVSNYPLVEYMVFAYKLNTNQRAAALSQMPKWAGSARYDIEARGPANATKDQFRLMMQSLLADRFKLAIHFEQRTTRVLALVVDKTGKLGPRLRVHVEDPPCATAPSSSGTPETVLGGFPMACGATQIWPSPTAGRLLWGSRNMTIANIARAGNLANLADTELPIVDKTRLLGTYDFVVEFTPDTNSAPSANATSLADSSGPNFLEAIKEQLGLRFESQNDLANVLVIDHIEEPSPN